MLLPKQLRSNPDAAAALLTARALHTLPPPRPADDAGLRIATYNIHKGVSALGRRSNIHALRAGLADIDADIVFLQEVQGRNDLHAKRFADWPGNAQHDFLAEGGWPEAVYGRNAVNTGRHWSSDHGNAMLSRFAITDSENIDISDHRFESRGLLHTVMDVGGQRVHCLCAHLGLFEDSRLRQIEAMVARIRDTIPQHEPLIIAGDFNDWRNRLTRKLVPGLDLREVFSDAGLRPLLPLIGRAAKILPARTFPSAFPFLRLDRVYVRGFSVRQAAVLHGGQWRQLSDHSPVVVDLLRNW